MNLFSVLIGLAVVAVMILVLPYLFIAMALFYVAFKISMWLTQYFNKSKEPESETFYAKVKKSKIVELHRETDENGKVIFE